MRYALMILGWAVLLSVGPVYGETRIDDMLLTPGDVTPFCEAIKGNHPERNEPQVFFDRAVHSELLPLVLNKRSQSFKCGRQKGTLYFFEYGDTEKREKAEVYARTTLWGNDTTPTAKHTEQIFHSGRYLMISSFKDPQKDLLTALLKRIKSLDAAATSNNP